MSCSVGETHRRVWFRKQSKNIEMKVKIVSHNRRLTVAVTDYGKYLFIYLDSPVAIT